MSEEKKNTRKIDIDAINKNVNKLDKKMEKVRREFKIKQAKSRRSAAKIILNS